MKNNVTHIVFGVALVLLVGVLGGLIAYQENVLRRGETTILKTRPVDPRDLFRGEYVILRYEIETNELIEEQTQNMQYGSSVFVRLAEDNTGVVTAVTEVSQTPPQAFTDELWLRGEVRSGRVRFPDLEQFYVPEGAGRPIEDFRDKLHVEISLHQGKARIVRLLDESLTEIDPKTYLE